MVAGSYAGSAETPLTETPDRIEEVLRSVELPWLLQVILDFLATHPATAALLLLGLLGGLAAAIVSNRLNTRRLERALEDREESFPRRDWEVMGRLDATRLIDEAIELFDRRGNKEGVATHHAVRGLLYLQRGDASRAESALHKALDLFEAMGHKEGIAFYGHQLSLLYREQNDIERALVYTQRSIAMYREMGERPAGLDLLNDLKAREEG